MRKAHPPFPASGKKALQADPSSKHPAIKPRDQSRIFNSSANLFKKSQDIKVGNNKDRCRINKCLRRNISIEDLDLIQANPCLNADEIGIEQGPK
jgi:hypothetical protein